jgi:hypothetical protein
MFLRGTNGRTSEELQGRSSTHSGLETVAGVDRKNSMHFDVA